MSNYQRCGNDVKDKQYYYLLLMLFVMSGCSALIYEVVWFQMLELVIGLSALSLGVLLATYMAGMFLGSILLHRLIPKKAHPLRVYAILEAGVGICGILLLFGVPLLDQLYVNSAVQGFASILLRCAVSAICFLPPTLLMGATLPAIARWVERTPSGVSWLGFFYSANIAGGVGGCLLAGFYLLRLFDPAVATYVAASMNFAIAGIAIWLAGRTSETAVPSPALGAVPAREAGFPGVYLVTALSGLTALGAEVVWTRLSSLLLGATVYTFAIILAVFLVGLGIGSSAGSFLGRKLGYPRLLLAGCQLLLTAAIAWAAFAITNAVSFWPVDPAVAGNPWYTFLLDFIRSLSAILPAAFLWGASFPLALASVASPDQEPGQLVSEVYASNTLGSIIGAIGFSLTIVPQLGTQQAQQVMVVICGLSAVVMFAISLRDWKQLLPKLRLKAPALLTGSVVCAIAVTTAVTAVIPETPWGMAAYGRNLVTWASRIAPCNVPEKKGRLGKVQRDLNCIYFGEGMSESVVVATRSDGVRSFHASGKAQASSDPDDMRLQRMLGHISALTVDNPRKVLVVACGAGVTAGTYTLYPSVQSITICDLEKLVPRYVAPLFKKENYNVVDDPRTRVVIDDGRHFVRTTPEKFDVITSDPVDPWIKGAAALYTEEYFTAARQHLNPGGVMAVWIPFYESSPEVVKSLFAAFFKVFPEGLVWSNDKMGMGYDAVLFAQAGPASIDVDKIQERLNSQEYQRVARSLDEIGFHSAVDLFSTFAGYGPSLRTWLQDAQLNTDRNMRLQYLAGMSFRNASHAEILDEILLSYAFPDKVFHGSEKTISQLKQQAAKRH